MFLTILDVIRIASVCAAFFFGYQTGFAGETYDPAAQLHLMTPIIIIAVAGISGLEGLLFGKKSAEAKGFETGSNYQRQSAIALLSYAAAALSGVAYGLGRPRGADHPVRVLLFLFLLRTQPPDRRGEAS